MTTAGEFLWPVRVYYEDTDAGGVVYYANYLRFMERARTEWLRALGFEQDRLAAEGVLFMVARIAVDYLAPARFNDRLDVGVRLERLARASFELSQTVCGPPAGRTLCRGHVRIACVHSQTLKPRAIPPAIRQEVTREH